MSYAQQNSGTPRIYLIQYLRAVSALMVVFHHARNPWDWTVNPFSSIDVGQAGVDLFFVISGFIMVHVERSARPDEFMIRRIIRVVPLYWMATTLAIVKDAAAGHAYTPSEALMSYMFLPFRNAGENMGFFPILVPGWTLNYEMAFYLVFALALALRGVGVWLIPFGLLLFGLFAIAFNLAGETIKAFYFDPIVLEFLAGALLAIIYRHLSGRWTLALAAALPVGIALLFLLPAEWPRALGWGLPATLIVFGALYVERNIGELRWKPLLMLGNASYSIYLTHTLFMGAIARVVSKVLGYGLLGFSTFMAATVGASIVVGCLVYLYVETPVIWWLKGGSSGKLQPAANPRSRRKF
jgi:exopolysaccharide production protein ExoZ